MTADQPQPHEVQVQVVHLPGEWLVGVAPSPTGSLVMVQVSDAIGARVYFLEPDLAVNVARLLMANATQARTGLIVPNGNGGL